jgi:hypothetical protein
VVNLQKNVTASVVSHFTPPPPADVQELVERIRVPLHAGPAHEVNA